MISLYQKSGDSTSKVCDLPDCTSCKVTEELNTSFELVLAYPLSGKNYSEIRTNRLVSCKPNPYDNEQLFRIYKIGKPMNGTVSVYAEHISYALNKYICEPYNQFKDIGSDAVSMMLYLTSQASNNSINSGYYLMSFYSTISKGYPVKWSVDGFKTIKEVMSQAVSLWGGEWKFTNATAELLASRGQDRGVYVRYAENMTDFSQTIDNSSMYTHLMPYAEWKNGDTTEYIYYTGMFYPISISQPETDYFKPYLLNVTNLQPVAELINTGVRPTSGDVGTACSRWLVANEAAIGIEQNNFTIGVVQRGKTAEYMHLTDADHIELGDIIHIDMTRLGITASRKCVKTIYDAIADRLVSVELGTLKKSIVDTTVKIGKTSENKSESAEKEADEIPNKVEKISKNEVHMTYSDKLVKWLADGDGNVRTNLRKSVEPIGGGDV